MLRQISGNARACIIVEPLFIIPYSLFITYASVYMLVLGLTEMQIGLITSIGLIVQIFSSFVSGFLTDKLGRKYALLIFDLLSWSVATLLWAISQNFWFFLVAAIINGFHKIPHIAWTCLIVEDTEKSKRALVYTILQLIAVIGGLFAPLAGLLISQMSLVPAMRLMYFIAFLSMTLMFIIRHFTTYESEIGIRKKQEAEKMNIKKSLQVYGETVANLLRNKTLLLLFSVYVLFQFQLVMQNTYLSIYLVDVLAFKDATIAIFPAASSICMLVLLFIVIPRIKEDRHQHFMIIGFVLSIIALIILVLTEQGNITAVLICTILLAAGLLLSNPYLETAVANVIEDDNRANMFSILQVIVLLFISPAGIIGGITYKIDPKIPFLLMAVALFFCIGIILASIRRQKELDK
ncbi:MFS transporter [Halalkalibacter akibai]|uniref:Major facilitator superfamily MFS_1 n=1 Tax=Halalkalibacter akibai (strain ATCC 43226 / DSM 21942 / CIP 109018 / JCM 9157 / 1139) TaxID=1236973 RepID=W4QQW7_HALA3|nr:MFS transporter [Halalkalibacter akibai]GAE34327.1 major facilitator superfamily MFS_1 [Halalkalibacter akibai JCM 9157]